MVMLSSEAQVYYNQVGCIMHIVSWTLMVLFSYPTQALPKRKMAAKDGVKSAARLESGSWRIVISDPVTWATLGLQISRTPLVQEVCCHNHSTRRSSRRKGITRYGSGPG